MKCHLCQLEADGCVSLQLLQRLRVLYTLSWLQVELFFAQHESEAQLSLALSLAI